MRYAPSTPSKCGNNGIPVAGYDDFFCYVWIFVLQPVPNTHKDGEWEMYVDSVPGLGALHKST